MSSVRRSGNFGALSMLCAMALVTLAGGWDPTQGAVGPPSVQGAWSRATPPGVTVGVAYFEILNPGPADTLVAIQSAWAQRVEMHSTTVDGGSMQMRQIDSVAVPGGGRLSFAPGGMHVMLVGLKQALKAGDNLPLTLTFRRAGNVSILVHVRGVTDAAEAPQADAPPAAGASLPGDFRLAMWPPRAESPDFALMDFNGTARTLADYRGRVVVVFFGFVQCPDACPAELFKLGAVMRQLGPASARVSVLFVTLDPHRDTRKVLKTYVTAFDPRFVGLTGSTPQIDRAATKFHVEYARVVQGAGYTIDHSSSTFVFDVHGRLRLMGALNTPMADYAHDLAALARE